MGRELTETEIQSQCLEYLKAMGVFCWRQNNLRVQGRTFRGMHGLPDIIGVLNDGRFFGCEIKKEKTKQSDPQKEFESKITELGAVYILARGVQDLVSNSHVFRRK